MHHITAYGFNIIRLHIRLKSLIATTSAARHVHAPSRSLSSASARNTTKQSKLGLRKVLVANRGEIACRVIATASKMGLPTVAVYSEADQQSAHVKMADESICIGPALAKLSYLQGNRILEAALKLGADAVHPGYGFLSENAGFAALCEQQGVHFVGPPAAAIRAMGDKAQAKALMAAADVPVVPGYHGEDQTVERLTEEANSIGFPLLIKAVAGGGGKGMRLANSSSEFHEALASAQRESAAAFGNDRVLLERWVQSPRHVEVQVFADKHGGAVYLFDRDCSVQRRHQKVIEEAPAPGLPQDLHRQLGEAAVRAARAAGYVGAGTVEFLLEPSSLQFFFMEMNTRLQVEHPVTEAVTGLDLVEWQLRVAAGEPLPLSQEQLSCSGHAMEVRLYAESPLNSFLPGAGRVRRWRPPGQAATFQLPGQKEGWVRVDSGVREGDNVGTFYDPMIAKIITWGEDRGTALSRLSNALVETQVGGLPTNLGFLQRLAAHPAFTAADLSTDFIPQHKEELLHVAPLPTHVAALAAVARVKLQVGAATSTSSPQAGQLGPWGIADGKRLWHRLTRTYPMEYPEAGQQLQAAVTFLSESSYAVRLGQEEGAAVCGVRSVRMVEEDRLEAEVDGRLYQANVLQYRHAGEEVLILWLDGTSYELRWRLPQWSKDAKAHATGGEVSAPMPGRIIKVLVEEGQEVGAGQALVVVEAMKMEHTLSASRAGRVIGLSVSTGAQVEDGQVLLRIKDPDS